MARPLRPRSRRVLSVPVPLASSVAPVVVLPAAAATIPTDPALVNLPPPLPISTIPVLPFVAATPAAAAAPPVVPAPTITTAVQAPTLAPVLPIGPALLAGVPSTAAHPLATSACGIVTPAINVPAVRTRHQQGHLQRYVCVLCGMAANRALSIRTHFPSCARANGDPQGHHWFDHASLAGFTHRDLTRTTYSTDR